LTFFSALNPDLYVFERLLTVMTDRMEPRACFFRDALSTTPPAPKSNDL